MWIFSYNIIFPIIHIYISCLGSNYSNVLPKFTITEYWRYKNKSQGWSCYVYYARHVS